LRLTDKRLSTFLFATQGVGIIFVGIFLAAYLGGLPTTNVLHSEPALRIPLAVIGGVFLVLALVTVVLFVVSRKDQ
jgi:hypothetical protein